ncbi:MAG TPA: IS3 family transposase [Chloroflexi bacterium]|nr:IS3 family transposase [Candidatus Methylomirabilis sp.]HBY94142.1 IS3 family transposase [Chloroflexota bacterium]
MGEARRTHTRAFKIEAVRLITERGLGVTQAARDLGIHPTLLTRWKRELSRDDTHAFPGKGRLKPLEEEVRRLRRENLVLKQEREILKKAGGLLRHAVPMRYRFIHQHRWRFPVGRMCALLAVSRSGYYGWRRRPESERDRQNRRRLVEIRTVQQTTRGVYGSPRVHAELRARGHRCGRHRVARLMQQEGLRARQRRAFKRTTTSSHRLPVAPNLLQRRFQASRPNETWVADITFIPTREGWLYLAGLVDVCSRMIVGWGLSDRLTRPLVMDALEMALGRRRPPRDLLHHSDRGSQYASQEYQALLHRHSIRASMSRTGDCWDNALMESAFGRLKSELVHLTDFATRAQARAEVFDYIEVFYNRQRRHSSLGYLSPAAFEASVA